MIIPAMKKTYNGQVVLDFEGLEIEGGKIYALMGDNGSGKSTLAKILSGIIPSDKGKYKADINIGYLSQAPYVFNLTVKNNILQNSDGMSKEEANKRCEFLMNQLGISDIANKKAIKVSGGEKAKMALCRILMKKYDLLILDEPTSSMDGDSVLSSFELIKKVAFETGATVIVIIHGEEYAKMIASKAIILNHSGTLKEFSDL